MYAKPTIATVNAVEEGKILRFEQFVNENDGFNMFAEAEDEIQDLEENPAESPKMADEAEVDPEQLENLMAEFGEDLEEMIADIAEKMEMEKDQICDLLCAAVKKLCNEEAEEEAEEGEEDGSDDDSNEVKDEE
jgi:hypothetical protein